MSDDTFLYLETRGRKSGLPRGIEIWFVEVGACCYIVAEMRERAQWVQNVLASAQVRFAIGTSADQSATAAWQSARARVLDPNSDAELSACVQQAMVAKYGWSDGLLVELAPDDVTAL